MAAEALLGMLGPLVAGGGTWVLLERVHARDPRQVTAFLVKAFAAKMVFFAVYVVVMLAVLSLEPQPFVVAFTACFLALHLAEAVRLRRLAAAGGRRPAPGAIAEG